MSKHNVKIWDSFTRVYHISQLVLLACLWYTGEEGIFEWHFIAGFTLLALWLTRIFWGFAGSQTSRFSHFIKTPVAVVKAWRNNDIARPHVGHNPVGGYMVMALLLTLGLQLTTGLFSSDDVFSEGPLYAYVSEDIATFMVSWHKTLFDVLLILIGLHAIAGILHWIRGDNVIGAIFTGRKNKTSLGDETQVQFKNGLIAIVIWVLLSAVVNYFGLNLSSY
ncbi:cytochrome b/b6 domain-containing protein [Thalassotalea litorea]|uniref:cytochrome b/b6 domain-containing protein n=1 Tax=Thalassotalea litorea TaxID=2020715 RepID=UPI0037351CFC